MFLRLILIPFVGDLVEHWTAVVVAFTGKADLAIGIALGSSVQVAALVLPIVVLVSWIPRVKSLSVVDYFQITCLAVTGTLISVSNPGCVVDVGQVQRGRSNTPVRSRSI
jgi:Ca2+:H+ antiporter